MSNPASPDDWGNASSVDIVSVASLFMDKTVTNESVRCTPPRRWQRGCAELPFRAGTACGAPQWHNS